MTDKINTEAKYLLQNIDFGGEGAHLAYTLGSGAASGMNDYYMLKSDDVQLDEEQQSILKGIIEKAEGDLPNSAFAYVPDADKTSSRKLRIDDANHTRAAVAALGAGFRGNKVEIPEKDMASVKRKVRAAYRKYFPDNDMPEVLKSLEEGSDVVSGSNNTTDSSGKSPDTISKNKEETMTTEVVNDNKDFEAIQKALEENTALLKAAEERALAAEKEAEEIKKAAEQAEIQKAKDDLTQVVKGWESVSEEDRPAMVEALYKAEDSLTIIKHMEAQEERINKLKEDFGTKEHGADGEVVVKSHSEEQKAGVLDILKNRKANKAQ